MSLNSTPRTWIAGETVTAVEFNTEVRDALAGIQAAASSYVPTWANLAVGNGTVAAFAQQVGKWWDVRITLTFGSTTAVTGAIGVSLPATPIQDSNAGLQLGQGVAWDTSASTRVGQLVFTLGSSTAYWGDLAYSRATATVPFTWATGDVLDARMRFEAV